VIPTRRSTADQPNPLLREVQRAGPHETNRAWVLRQATDEEGDQDLVGRVLLLGGTTLTDFRVRVAQSHARHDMTPSLWSHVAVIRGPARPGRAARGKARERDLLLYEVSLDPAGGFGAVPRDNGVQEGLLSRYDDPARYPNIALLRFLPVERQALEQAVHDFRRERRLIDIGALILEWLGFAWGVGAQGNPLIKEAGLPCAAFVEGAFELLGLDLTPGSSTRASSPEAIWQAARWWHGFYEMGAAAKAPPSGEYCVGQRAACCLFE
jgi:hypothetical protein